MDFSKFDSQITFLYFKNLDEAFPFFEKVLNLELVDDQGTARLYRISSGAFIGIVDEKTGHCKSQDKNAVLITLVTDDLQTWYERLKRHKVELETSIQRPQDFPVECFFFRGPGGYEFEIQKFLKEDTRKVFL
ncbi:VOC family protein [Acetomicrobium sp.]|uniref:VOC family protein n=1 Tax=Acetomicrobium sp. TaxID=1872099 RepID=UPI002FC90F02